MTEQLSKEEIKQIEEEIKDVEEKAIAHIEELNMMQSKENEKESASQNSQDIPEYNDPDYMPPTGLEGYIPEEEMEGALPPIPEDINEYEEQEYIMGKPSKAKENKVNIKDITASNSRITIEGRILTSECRETRTGKGMLIFDIYDGTGTITCKSFAKDISEGKEVIEKIQNAKAIKAIGKAGLDAYAGDVTIMANTIIASNSDVPELPEDDEDTPLILGMNPNITENVVKISELNV